MTVSLEEINLPDVLAELSELYPRYERALVSNDVDTLVPVPKPEALASKFSVAGAEKLAEPLLGVTVSQPAGAEVRR